MSWIERIVAVLVLLLLGGFGSLPFVLPAAAAYVCPSCYGFSRIGENVYFERDAEPGDVLNALDAARQRVTEALTLEASPAPTWLICASEACDRRLGGKGARARAFGDIFIAVSPRGHSATILSHELSHIALHRRVSGLDLLLGVFPAWKNEGIAVLVSGDERYVDFDASRPECRAEPKPNLPTTPRAWGRAMQPETHLSLYSQAACAVLRVHGPPPYDLETLLREPS